MDARVELTHVSLDSSSSSSPCDNNGAAETLFPVFEWAPIADVRHLKVVVHGVKRRCTDPFAAMESQPLFHQCAVWAPLFRSTNAEKGFRNHTNNNNNNISNNRNSVYSSFTANDTASTYTAIDSDLPTIAWKRPQDYTLGIASSTHPQWTSFTAFDALLRHAVERFPGLESLTLVGFSAGSQFLNRYAAVSTHLQALASTLPTLLVFGTASSWLYLDSRRFDASSTFLLDSLTHATALPAAAFKVPSVFDTPAPNTYNKWKYGLDNAPSADQPSLLASRLLSYRIAFIYVEDDDKWGSSLDMAQECLVQCASTSRYARMCVYVQYLRACWNYTPFHSVVVDGCGHDAAKVYAKPDVQDLILGFPSTAGAMIGSTTNGGMVGTLDAANVEETKQDPKHENGKL
ncbi:hypothetical protein BC830DRAFT_1159641 [Chytriomyces sp. MP71]|nr:hypothetical protein BC830DRAFT_1159641 [Chytriomyces sp. MP71]